MTMKTPKLLFCLAATLLPAQLWAAECYSYEPEKSHVPGNLQMREDRTGTEVFILITEKPLCVEGGENPELNVPERDITELQVLYKDPQRIQVLIGKDVQVDGWLFHNSGDDPSQVTEVLIDARKIKPKVVW